MPSSELDDCIGDHRRNDNCALGQPNRHLIDLPPNMKCFRRKLRIVDHHQISITVKKIGGLGPSECRRICEGSSEDLISCDVGDVQGTLRSLERQNVSNISEKD